MFDFKKSKKLISKSLNKISEANVADNEKSVNDHFFFHDIINQTHGLLLYLSQRDALGEGASPSDVKKLMSEIKNLQLIICDHYKITHKNIQTKKRFIQSEEVKLCLENLVGIYLKHKNVDLKIKISTDQALFPQSVIQRIFNNLIKNMNEIESNNFFVELNIDEEGLHFYSSNELPGVESEDKLEYIQRLISEETIEVRDSLGLDSIYTLSLESNGTFNFSIDQGRWINELFLPNILFKTKAKKAS